MTPLRTVAWLLLIGCCAEVRAQHPIDRQLPPLRPVTITPLTGLAWPAGTLLCPLTPYQSTLPGSTATAQRVNAFLEKKRFLGDESHWSLIVIQPAPVGNAAIEHLIFKRKEYDVVTSIDMLQQTADAIPSAFKLKACMEAQEARVLATRARLSRRTLISFGTQ
jgi:hypothetical protein